MNQEEKEKIKIKLERHKWPDEIAAEKKKRKKIGVNIISIVLIFAIGWTFGSVFYQSPGTVQDVNVARFARVYDMLKSNWFFINEMDNPDTQLIENAIKGMIDRNGDSHTSYMTEEESQQFSASIDLSFVGIGVTYQPADRLITRVFKDSPAEKAGIEAGDIMISVDDVMLSTLEEGADLKEYILGEKGTIVKIGVERNAEIKNFDVTRDNINALTWGEMLDDETAYL
ncbi:MAG: PDZ domain-containing protein, partial [Erysipelothrix sp.]|nr:PDZ domain-containing protein [Erysipelothrix sp.]